MAVSPSTNSTIGLDRVVGDAAYEPVIIHIVSLVTTEIYIEMERQ